MGHPSDFDPVLDFVYDGDGAVEVRDGPENLVQRHIHGRAALADQPPVAPVRTTTERFHVVDARTGAVTRYALSTVAHTEQELVALIAGTGFRDVVCHPSLVGIAEESADDTYAVVARK